MIYFVRHGQTDWNVLGKIQGHADIELNEMGIKQAEELREKFKNVKFDKVFCSPLKRARKTAEIIYNGQIEIDERLKERCNGTLEGKTKKEIQKLPDFNSLDNNEYGIETLRNLNERIKSFITEVMTKYKNKNILVVTHAGVCIHVKAYFEGEPTERNFESYKLKNGEFLMYKN